MVEMTFDEYDGMMEEFEQIGLTLPLPDPWELEILQSDVERFLPYACYLDEYGKEPETAEEKYRRKGLRAFIRENLELV